jgi:hypothetical protein
MIDFERLKAEGYDVDPARYESTDDRFKPTFERDIKLAYYKPGTKIRLNQQTISEVLRRAAQRGDENPTIESFANAGDRHFEVERVYVRGDFEAGYVVKGVDLEIPGQFVTDARPTKHMFGIVLVHDDRLFAVELDGNFDDPKAKASYEIRGGVEEHFGFFWDVTDIDAMKAVLENREDGPFPAVSGEFTLADIDDGIWALSALSWSSGVNQLEVDAATHCIEAEMISALKLN